LISLADRPCLIHEAQFPFHSIVTGKKVRYDNSLENYSRFLKDFGLDVNEVLELDAAWQKAPVTVRG
jgi:hypothetical protein